LSSSRAGRLVRRYRDPQLEVPELDAGAKPRLTVKLTRTALDVFRAELAGLGPVLLERGYESGGNLIGRNSGGVREVVDASGPEDSPGDRSERRFRDAVRICAASGFEIAEELREHSGDRTIQYLGGWHLHGIPEPQPSTTDRVSALRSLELLRELDWRAPEEWVELIVYPDPVEGFDRLCVAGWATRPLPWKGAVTEPVRIELA
jgi:hypothetical protein